jgi:hypothetical protein
MSSTRKNIVALKVGDFIKNTYYTPTKRGRITEVLKDSSVKIHWFNSKNWEGSWSPALLTKTAPICLVEEL